MPSVKELEAFVAVVEAGSFEAAARRLNATPPAVSKRISELESELGVRLFERSTRRCHITPRGRTLVQFAQRVLGDIGEIQRTVGERSSLAELSGWVFPKRSHIRSCPKYCGRYLRICRNCPSPLKSE